MKKEKTFSLRLCSVPILSFYLKPGFGWVRVFGKGLYWKDIRRHELVFSDRVRKRFQIGPWIIKTL